MWEEGFLGREMCLLRYIGIFETAKRALSSFCISVYGLILRRDKIASGAVGSGKHDWRKYKILKNPLKFSHFFNTTALLDLIFRLYNESGKNEKSKRKGRKK